MPRVQVDWFPPQPFESPGRFFDMDLQRKIDFAIKVLQSIPQDGPIELSYSGGKDSDVILELARMSGIPFEAIYKNTTIDPPGTIAHCKENGVTIVQPKQTFMEIIETNSVPTRWSRFCCGILKEYKIYDRAIQGIRREESAKRAELYKEPEYCRTYSKGGKVRVYLPILEWTKQDVEQFINDRGIKCAPLYYDKDGKFHVERRLGCIGCPLASDNGRKDYRQYPKLLKRVIRAAQTYLDTHPNTRAAQIYDGSGYNLMFSRLFCGTIEKYRTLTGGGMFPETAINPKQYLEDYFGIEL